MSHFGRQLMRLFYRRAAGPDRTTESPLASLQQCLLV